MIYTLWNKNAPIADLKIEDPSYPYVSNIIKLWNPEFRPVQIGYKKGVMSRRDLNHWLLGRKIPASRQNIDKLLTTAGIEKTEELILKNFALSLSDQYWIAPKNSNIAWKDVNFFTNDFSEEMGTHILYGFKDSRNIDLRSPDNTSDGWLKKTWKIIDGERYLFKGGSGFFKQEVFNEVIASDICKMLGIHHVDYDFVEISGEYFSYCKDFIDSNTELVPVNAVRKMQQQKNHIPDYDFYINLCEDLGIDNAKTKIDQMLFLDYVMANEDRHYNNFGLIRHVETLEFLDIAPIYDTGTSLYYNQVENQILYHNIQSKPFKTDPYEQIQLAELSNFSISISLVSKIIQNTLSKNKIMEENSPDRKFIISEKVEKNLEKLHSLIHFKSEVLPSFEEMKKRAPTNLEDQTIKQVKNKNHDLER